MSMCPNDETVALFVDGGLAPEAERAIRLHVDQCQRCRQVLANLVATGEVSQSGAHEGLPVRIGEVVRGKYRIDGVLGAGGMATVFRAHHLGLGRTVAIKVMHRELLRDADAMRRFSHEARAAAAIDHPHAVRILDIDALEEEDALPFLVMEYLEGKDLNAVVEADGPLAIDRALRYIAQAAAAAGAGHALGIVHRDIKPHNLFVTMPADLVKVVDFGLAKSLPLATTGGAGGAASQNTKTSVLLGSPHYMSPEQVRSSRSVDAMTDIWSLGATLFHLLVGRPPFAAPNVYLLCARILSDEPPPLSSQRRDVTTRVEAIVTRCMRKTASDRFRSVEELIGALEDATLHLAEDETAAWANPKTKRIPNTLVLRAGADDTVPMSYAETGTHGLVPGQHQHPANTAPIETPPAATPTDPMIMPMTENPSTPQMATPKKR
jgi:serine/threonine protein kinase